MQEEILNRIQEQPVFQSLVADIRSGKKPGLIGLSRVVRLPVLATLKSALNRPILLITDRTDERPGGIGSKYLPGCRLL
jgi:hypothetical protein